MSSEDPLEKKLIDFYDTIMNKLKEVLQSQFSILSSQKEIKHDLAKVKEQVLESKSTIQQIDIRTEYLKNHSNPNRSDGFLHAKNKSRSSSNSNLSHDNPTQRNAMPQRSNANLKDYLSQQLAIFDVKVLNTFIKITKEIILANAKIEATFIKATIDTKSSFPIVVAGKIEISRDKETGAMALCLERSSANEMTRAIYTISEDDAVSDFDIKDITAEICVEICEKAKLALQIEGYNFNILMKEVHLGNAHDLYNLIGYPKIFLHFSFNQAPFYLYFWG